tara:strand:+ start:931 stop:1083 length:153 start_codon:yes stop_codon:yes gene_type:complete
MVLLVYPFWSTLIHKTKQVTGNPPHLDFLCAFRYAVSPVMPVNMFKWFMP